MIDFVGRDVPKARTQTHPKGRAGAGEIIRFVCLAFPVVFTVLFILNQILEHASRHG